MRPLKAERRGLIAEVPLFEASIPNCATGKQDFDCSQYDYDENEEERRDVDLSSLARDKNAANNKDDSDEEKDDNAGTPKPRIGLPADGGIQFGR